MKTHWLLIEHCYLESRNTADVCTLYTVTMYDLARVRDRTMRETTLLFRAAYADTSLPYYAPSDKINARVFTHTAHENSFYFNNFN